MRTKPAGTPHGLSKSKLLSSLQCAKRLWLEVHRPEAVETSPAAEQRYRAGHRVGEIARRLEGSGVLIESQQNLAAALSETSTQIDAGAKILFEPAFRHGGVLVRADILRRRRAGYDVREVKSSTSVKDHHLQDAAIQTWVLQGTGIKMNTVVVQHLNKNFVYPGDDNYRGLFVEESVDSEIRPLLKDVPKWVAAARATLAGSEPEVRTGKHCSKPYDCPCFAYCVAKEPQTEYPIAILPRAGKILPRLTEEGYRDVREIPPGRLTSENHERVRRITRSGKRELSAGAKEAMRKLPYPRYYLDFETIGFPVPVWVGTRPYQQIPFQWSCHVEHAPGRLEHRAHLDVSGNAPMQSVADSLLKALGDKGPILAHNAGFEKARIEELARMLPKRAAALRRLASRLVDTLALSRAHYYHPAMKGSWSLKAILPTIAPELDYGNVGEVQDGGAASAAYAELIAPATGAERKAELKSALERYCERDTLALVRLASFFQTGR